MIIPGTLYVDLDIEISTEEYDLELEQSEESFEVDLDNSYAINQIVGDRYEGEYVVDPDFEQNILPTRNKTLIRDITVNAIEVSRVSNHSGGMTVYIGGIFDG